jgi:hypothetical protein
VDKQTGAEHSVTAARIVITAYGPNVDGIFPKAYVNIVRAKFSIQLICNKTVGEKKMALALGDVQPIRWSVQWTTSIAELCPEGGAGQLSLLGCGAPPLTAHRHSC